MADTVNELLLLSNYSTDITTTEFLKIRILVHVIRIFDYL